MATLLFVGILPIFVSVMPDFQGGRRHADK
jgi:hypothetical protein